MTEAELEAALGRLGQQVAELQKQQEKERKHWLRWGQIFVGIAVGLYLVFMVIDLIYGNNRGMPDIVALLIFVSLAFSGAPGPHPPMTMSIGERLRWVWSA